LASPGDGEAIELLKTAFKCCCASCIAGTLLKGGS
jgi:hypothetical protein